MNGLPVTVCALDQRREEEVKWNSWEACKDVKGRDEQEQWVWVVEGGQAVPPEWRMRVQSQVGTWGWKWSAKKNRWRSHPGRSLLKVEGREWQDWTRFRQQVLVAVVQDEGGRETAGGRSPVRSLLRHSGHLEHQSEWWGVAVSRLLKGSGGPLDVAAEGLALWVSVCPCSVLHFTPHP